MSSSAGSVSASSSSSSSGEEFLVPLAMAPEVDLFAMGRHGGESERFGCARMSQVTS